MTNEEALNEFVTDCGYCQILNCEKCREDFAIKALEKQIPKKPTYKRSFGYMKAACPCCGRFIWTEGDGKEPYCWKCGQRIDWVKKND